MLFNPFSPSTEHSTWHAIHAIRSFLSSTMQNDQRPPQLNTQGGYRPQTNEQTYYQIKRKLENLQAEAMAEPKHRPSNGDTLQRNELFLNNFKM